MNSQGRIEQILKDIHLMVAKAPQLQGEPNSVVIDKTELLQYLEAISRATYDMMDEYAISNQERERVKRELREEGEAIVQNANERAEDVYGASVLYMDDAIIRLVRILEETQRSVDTLYKDINYSIDSQIRELRTNQNELQDQMLEMRDANIYLSVLNERRKKIEKNKQEMHVFSAARTQDIAKQLQEASLSIKAGRPEIKINQAYFAKKGIDPSGVEPISEPKKEAPEVKVNLDSNYFKWKRQQEEKREK